MYSIEQLGGQMSPQEANQLINGFKKALRDS